MLLYNIKSIIKYAIELDIDYIETFLGYEGDNVLRISTKSEDIISLLKTYVENLDLEYKYEYELLGKNGPSYAIYIGVEDPSVFKLKKD